MQTQIGGTAVWCPNCKKFANCAVIPGDNDYRRTETKGIGYFNRYRRCMECQHDFWTSEVPNAWIQNLVEANINYDRLSIKTKKIADGMVKLINMMNSILPGKIDMNDLFDRADLKELQEVINSITFELRMANQHYVKK